MNPQAARYQTTYAEPAPPPAAGSLLDAVLAATAEVALDRRPAPAGATGRLEQFLREPDVGESVRLWLGEVPQRWKGELRRKLVQAINRDVARLDELLSAQLNAILHHPEFQKLEAAWRGLWVLGDGGPGGGKGKGRGVHAAWGGGVKDQGAAVGVGPAPTY